MNIHFPKLLLLLLFAFSAIRCDTARYPAEQPNILWLVSEDNSPLTIGAYGDPAAYTPTLDSLARHGILFENVLSNAPVCAVARSTLISGMYAPSTGMHQMRGRVHIPEQVERQVYPNLLREVGYYVTNNSKTDYNVTGDPNRFWDESSGEAHYRNRPEGKPFFAVFNFHETHESRMHMDVMAKDPLTDPEIIEVPPYHPDIPEIRRSWAHYFDRAREADEWVAGHLKALKEAGLDENTIVIYYSDHGGVLPRSKRFLYHTGTQVPLIISVPPKWQHLFEWKPGERVKDRVSFVDFAPTLLSLAGAEIPKEYQGRAFAGVSREKSSGSVYLYRDRMDEWYDVKRGTFDGTYRYLRNYFPHRPNGQPLMFLFRAQSTQAWYESWKDGETTAEQSAFWEPVPHEQLFHTVEDPWEVQNLADDPNSKQILKSLRTQTDQFILSTRDGGFIPEDILLDIQGLYAIEELTSEEVSTFLYDYFQSDAYDLPSLMEIADLAASQDPDQTDQLLGALQHQDAAQRFWGAVGFAALGSNIPNEPSIVDLLLQVASDSDEFASVRSSAIEALFHIMANHSKQRAKISGILIESVGQLLQSELDFDLVYLMNSLHYAPVPTELKQRFLPAMERIAQDESRAIKGTETYSKRISDYLVNRWSAD